MLKKFSEMPFPASAVLIIAPIVILLVSKFTIQSLLTLPSTFTYSHGLPLLIGLYLVFLLWAFNIPNGTAASVLKVYLAIMVVSIVVTLVLSAFAAGFLEANGYTKSSDASVVDFFWGTKYSKQN